MSVRNHVIVFGTALVSAWCLWGAFSQVRKGKTWGATGKSRVYRDDEPGYFWYLFIMRIGLGIFGIWISYYALQHIRP